MTEKYYKPKVQDTKDLNLKYDGVLSKFIDTSSGAIKVKLESDVIVQRISHDIYTSWKSGIRELLMNEIKACRVAKRDHNANPHVIITIDPTEKKFIMQGFDSMGMSGERFGEVVAVLGRSSNFDRSETGMFGMGIASYTTCTDTIKLICNSRETDDKFVVLGRNGTEWLPVEEEVDIPYGIRIEMTLNSNITNTNNYNKMIDIIKDCACQKEIPVTINLLDVDKMNDDDEDDDDDDDVESTYSRGKYQVELCDRIGYLKAKQTRKKSDYWNTKADINDEGGKYIEVNNELFDIVVSYNREDGGLKTDLLESKDLWVTLLDVPIEAGDGFNGEEVVKKLHGYVGMSDVPDFTSILINLKSEEVFEPKPDRDSLKADWYKEEMTESISEAILQMIRDVDFNTIEQVIDSRGSDRMFWLWFKKGMRVDTRRDSLWRLFYKERKGYVGGIDVEGNDKWNEEYNKLIMNTIIDRMYLHGKKKGNSIDFESLLTGVELQGDLYNAVNTSRYEMTSNYFTAPLWSEHKLSTLKENLNENDRAIVLKPLEWDKHGVFDIEHIEGNNDLLYKAIKKDEDKWDKILNRLREDTNLYEIQNNMGININEHIVKDLNQWIKLNKIKPKKIKRVVHENEEKNYDNLVWHYGLISLHNHNDEYSRGGEAGYNIFYEKERGRLINATQKKRTKIQLTAKTYGDKNMNKNDSFGGINKLSIDNAVDIITKIPNNIQITKADSHKCGLAVDVWIEEFMSEEIHTNDGTFTLREFIDKYRETLTNANQNHWDRHCEKRPAGDSKPMIYLTRFTKTRVADNKLISRSAKFKDILIIEDNKDKLVAIAFAFIIDGYIHNKTWRFSTNDKYSLISSRDTYYETKIKWKDSIKEQLPEMVSNMLKDERKTKNWIGSIDRNIILLGMLDLYSNVEKSRYKHYFNTLAFCQTQEEIKKELEDIYTMEEALGLLKDVKGEDTK